MKSLNVSALRKMLQPTYQEVTRFKSPASSECFLGKNVEDDEVVFIKVVNSHRYRRELNVLSLRDSSNVVHPIDMFYENSETCILVYPFFAAGNLKQSLKKNSGLKTSEIYRLAEDLLIGIRALHAAGIIHRDIKPENVLIDFSHDGKAHYWLADFGSSITISETAEVRWRGASPAYEAPEAFDGTADFRADFYSIGVVLLESATGGQVFQGMPDEIYWKAKHEFPSLKGLKNGRLRFLIAGLLQKDPEKRPASADAAIQQLRCRTQKVPPYLPTGKHTLVPSLSLTDVVTPSHRYDWIGCDEIGNFVAFAKAPAVSVYDYGHEYHGTVNWLGVPPIWFGSSLWYAIGSDIFSWNMTTGRKEFEISLGFIPDGYDVNGRQIAWVSHEHLMLKTIGDAFGHPRMRKMTGYVRDAQIILGKKTLAVVAGNSNNEILVFSMTLDLIRKNYVDGIIVGAKYHIKGYLQVLFHGFSSSEQLLLAVYSNESAPTITPLPERTLRASLTCLGAIVWAAGGVTLYEPEAQGVLVRKWQPRERGSNEITNRDKALLL